MTVFFNGIEQFIAPCSTSSFFRTSKRQIGFLLSTSAKPKGGDGAVRILNDSSLVRASFSRRFCMVDRGATTAVWYQQCLKLTRQLTAAFSGTKIVGDSVAGTACDNPKLSEPFWTPAEVSPRCTGGSSYKTITGA